MMVRRYLFIHQNFPAQFVHVAAALARQGHEVVALAITGRPVPGVRVVGYRTPSEPKAQELPLARDFLVKLVRARACMEAMRALAAQGFQPDVIVAHPGWGESLFCRDVWPSARIVIYGEFFYSTQGADYAFDPEFSRDTVEGRAALRIKNTVHLHALNDADVIYSPTEWQRSQLPRAFQDKARVMFDGIDTAKVTPDARAVISLQRDKVDLRRGDEVITFVNRNLEPHRGVHIFMRALPDILRRRPNARCIIIGRNEVSYGSRPPGGGAWKDYMLREVGARLPMDRVHFLGGLPYDQYLRVLQVSACHVYLTYPFVLSWSCLEAMAAECPLAASATGPVREVIRDGENGRLFDFFDVQGLADTVVELLTDPEQGRRLGRQARQDVVARYDLATVCLEGQLKIIDSALTGSAR